MADQLAPAQEIHGAGQSFLATISREMVRLYKDQFGRGRTQGAHPVGRA